jgi:hypothetical protein
MHVRLIEAEEEIFQFMIECPTAVGQNHRRERGLSDEFDDFARDLLHCFFKNFSGLVRIEVPNFPKEIYALPYGDFLNGTEDFLDIHFISFSKSFFTPLKLVRITLANSRERESDAVISNASRRVVS